MTRLLLIHLLLLLLLLLLLHLLLLQLHLHPRRIKFNCSYYAESDKTIKCYECEGSTENCDDEFNQKGIAFCTGTYCHKAKGGAQGHDYVTRSCVKVKPHNGCMYLGESETGYDSCYCDTNYCNSAVSLLGNIILMVAPLSLVIINQI
ncbi:hypothetical protein CAPTEDRAFT_200033 [Capitella teleta]|uniref:Protein quiver n=1 Tax=Capitella teleta TaxID=283909 RepID=R7UQP6_CAPTE|nr:hypothetical protein CAPTEDRAFT_200033 [Capitella teleta]|eukprot:ELU05736.1 hypothetical protein CAPTEDRAFT_200033 [Capitella teleta]